MLKRLETIGRVCFKSEDKITEDSYKQFIRGILSRGHEAIIEHMIVSVKIICDRGVSHELVRHRIASYAQESQRYCNYSKDKFDNEITFIKPCFWEEGTQNYIAWKNMMLLGEDAYIGMIERGATPEQARTVLPNSTKTEIVVTLNLREWRHFFKLRALGTTGKPHPQMLEISIPMLKEFKKKIPIVFEDLDIPVVFEV